MTSVVDTSVLLAIAFDERGAEEAQRLARGGLFGMANLVEAVTRGQEKGVRRRQRSLWFQYWGCRLLSLTAPPPTRPWRFGCIANRTFHQATGCASDLRARLPVVTGDRVWKGLSLGVDVRLFR